MFDLKDALLNPELIEQYKKGFANDVMATAAEPEMDEFTPAQISEAENRETILDDFNKRNDQDCPTFKAAEYLSEYNVVEKMILEALPPLLRAMGYEVVKKTDDRTTRKAIVIDDSISVELARDGFIIFNQLDELKNSDNAFSKSLMDSFNAILETSSDMSLKESWEACIWNKGEHFSQYKRLNRLNEGNVLELFCMAMADHKKRANQHRFNQQQRLSELDSGSNERKKSLFGGPR